MKGENTEMKQRPIDGSNELIEAILPVPKKDPKVNNN